MSTPLTAIRVEFFPDEYPGWQLFSGWMRRPSPIAGGADCREPSPSYPYARGSLEKRGSRHRRDPRRLACVSVVNSDTICNLLSVGLEPTPSRSN